MIFHETVDVEIDVDPYDVLDTMSEKELIDYIKDKLPHLSPFSKEELYYLVNLLEKNGDGDTGKSTELYEKIKENL